MYFFCLQILNQTNVALQRSKEAYFQRGGELSKLRREGCTSNKDLERADSKFRKAAEEYRNLVEKYAQLRDDFERKMTVSCRVCGTFEFFCFHPCNKIVFFYSIFKKLRKAI